MGMLPYTLSLVFATIISLIVSFLSFKRRPSTGAIPLAVLMLFIGEWIISQTFQDLSTSQTAKLFWYYVKFLGIIMVPPAWLIFAISYARCDRLLKRKFLLPAMIIPSITVILNFSNNIFYLFFKSIDFEKRGNINVVLTKDGIWFWVHTYYSYLLVLLGIIVIFVRYTRLPSIYKKQAGLLLVASFLPLIGNMLTIFRLIVFPYDDITPLALLISGILFFWGLFRYKLVDLVPVAHYAVIQSIKDFVMVLDNQNRIVDINLAARKYFGENDTKLIGKSASELLSKWSELVVRFKDVLETNEKIEIGEENHIRYFDLKISPVFDHKNRITARLFVLRDITELEEAITELKSSRAAAQAASKSKSQFLANMSHEIRTPMNAIIGMADLLDATQLNPEQREFLSLIRSSSNSLLTIINQILDFSKIEAGKLEIEKIPFNLRDLVSNTINPLIIQSNNKRIELLCTIDESIPDLLVGDPTRLKQILMNLIGNSIKFTPEDGIIEITINKCDDFDNTENSVNLKFSVSDTGIGIPEEKLGNLFESFQQLDSSTTRKYGGTGLGLAIVKNLIEMMGGSIRVTSKYKVGSTFYFTLNFDIADKSVHLDPKSAADSSDTVYSSQNKNIRILLAEDNKVNQMLMAKILEKQKNWTFDIADNGRKALEILEKKDFDIVLMDVQMPEMDGLEASLTIRSNESNTGKHMPIIALTANAMKGDREMCINAGMDDYLSKPIKAEKLFEMIEKYI